MANRQLATAGVFWNVVQTLGERFFQTLVFFVVARLLDPTAFGLASMAVAPAAVFTAVMQGASQVIVQDREASPAFISAAFWFNIVAGLALGVFVLVTSGPVSLLVHAPAVAPLMMATASVPLLAGLGAVSQGVMTRHFEFRMLAIRRTIGISVAGLACVVLAWLGYGAWSLVIQAILTPAVMSVVALLAGPVRVIEPFTGSEVRRVVRQSGMLYGSSFLTQGNTRLSDLIVGYFVGPAGAGAFRLARTVMDLITSVTFTPLANVLLPIFAKANEEPERALRMYVKIVVSCSLIFAGVEICTIFGAEAFRAVFLGKSWPGLGWVLIFLAPVFPTMAISPSQPLLIARGRAGMVLWANFVRLVVSSTCLAVGSKLAGVNGAAIGYTVCTWLALGSMLIFMRREIPELKGMLTVRLLLPQALALAIGLGGYSWALSLGLRPANILQAGGALVVALAVFGGLILILCRRDLDVAIDVVPVPGKLKDKARKLLRLA